ncbi:Uncharacterized protein Rs2_04165 [Raphanus sativus]|nr:Uncharacterized protein Rs2_04165 [Raphanus sativus]
MESQGDPFCDPAVTVSSFAASRRRLIRRRVLESFSPPSMGKGKKKKGHSPRSPAPSSPSSSPPLKDSKPISAASEPPSSSGNFTSGSASDAQITDLVAQQTRLDSDIESPALVTTRNASDAQVSESSSDLVAQQSESDSAKDSPVVATPQPASDAQIVHLPVNLVAQLNEEVSTQAATTGLVETSAVIAPVTADPVTKESPPEEIKKDLPQTTKAVCELLLKCPYYSELPAEQKAE